MRAIVFCLLVFCVSSFVSAQAVGSFVWDSPFAPITSGQADDHLVLMVISNDQQVVVREMDAKTELGKAAKAPTEKAPAAKLQPRRAKDKSEQPIWRKADVEFSYQHVLAKRADIADVCSLQFLAAGLPPKLDRRKRPQSTKPLFGRHL